MICPWPYVTAVKLLFVGMLEDHVCGIAPCAVRNIRQMRRIAVRWDASFPLTPALSLEEREDESPMFADLYAAKERRLADSQARPTVLPLPKGEGQGEREQSVLPGERAPPCSELHR